MKTTLTTFDRVTMAVAPRWTLERIRTRKAIELLARSYEAAQPGRRTSGWNRTRADINSIIGRAGAELRMHAQELTRNNGYARRGQRVIANNTVGWGIVPRPVGAQTKEAGALWKEWADSTQCEVEGRHTVYGIQHLALKTIVKSGEVLVRRRSRLPSDSLPVPLQLQVLDPEFIDSSHDGVKSPAGGPTILGVEFDAIGRRSAYWLFPAHPGSSSPLQDMVSKRVPASEIAHVFYSEDPNQVRGVSWLASAIVNMKDLDEYEDAELLKQKIAASFAAFVTDMDGAGGRLGDEDPHDADDLVDHLQPGMIQNLPTGKQITSLSPPNLTSDALPTRTLRKVAAGLGVSYEDLSGDYSNVNFSSARMGRISHMANVRDWQGNMMIPLLCEKIWGWFSDAAVLAGKLQAPMKAEWTAPPLPMIEPDKEGLAYQRLVRNGVMTHDDMIREQGGDPTTHWENYAAGLVNLDRLKIQLDSDVRAVSQAGLTQVRAGAGAGGGEADSPAEEPAVKAKAKEDRALTRDELARVRVLLNLPIPDSGS